MDILAANQKISQEDYFAYIERSCMFSLFFRGCPSIELQGFQKFFNMKDYGYVLILGISEINRGVPDEINIDEFELHHFIKKTLNNRNVTVGPLITNRISLLITDDFALSDELHRQDSFDISTKLCAGIETNFPFVVTIGIGSEQNINSIYSSYVDSITCLYYNATDKIKYYQDLKSADQDPHFDYLLTEKHLLDAIRLRKTDAYDYFVLIMDWIRPLSDETKRNKILEILVMANHAMRLDSQNEIKFIDYNGYFKEFMDLKGDQLIEFAFRSFVFISSYVKPQNVIDYSNHIVKATQAYLESHYTDDISLEDVAEQVNISPQYFSKLIKKTTGFNFIDWLSMLRVKKAKELLTNSNFTVKEVCFMVGYKDPNYFSRIFKKRIGITPSEYVKTSSYLNNKS